VDGPSSFYRKERVARETVGKISSYLLSRQTETQSPIDIQREAQKDYFSNLEQSLNQGLKAFAGDFYIVVITKKERLMQNVLRNYFAVRETCPTPDWDQTVWFARRVDQSIDYLWTIPAKDVCEHLKLNALYVVDAEKQLLNFVLKFEDGSLLKEAKKRNGEKFDSILIES